jgi:hypothetical protein
MIQITDAHIDDLLDFIQPNKFIPTEAAISISNSNRERLRKQLINKKIYPDLLTDLKEELRKNHFKSQIEPGESVGILCATSIGEKNTQQTLNTLILG